MVRIEVNIQYRRRWKYYGEEEVEDRKAWVADLAI
jgi:hypothetical protein